LVGDDPCQLVWQVNEICLIRVQSVAPFHLFHRPGDPFQLYLFAARSISVANFNLIFFGGLVDSRHFYSTIG
jgi:hypothetical protein